jgi:hypothetical protein
MILFPEEKFAKILDITSRLHRVLNCLYIFVLHISRDIQFVTAAFGKAGDG